MSVRPRRIGAVALAAVAAQSVCSLAVTTPVMAQDQVTITLAWWGNDTRNRMTDQLIQMFEEQHPEINVEPQQANWGGYWDLMATQTAAGETPDVIQMDHSYVATYAQSGILADLRTLEGFSLADFPEASLGPGTMNGIVYGVPAGQNTNMIVVNPDLLAKAGIEMPNDETWTWDDVKNIGAKVQAGGGGTVYGYEAWGYDGTAFVYWIRDKGDRLYDENGQVVVKPETLASYWQYALDLVSAGAAPPPSVIAETWVAGLSSKLMATNRVVFGDYSSNQLLALRDASGTQLELLRFPTTTQGAQFFLPSMMWSASARTEHPKETAMLLDFLVNNPQTGEVLLTERGVPVNPKVRAHIAPLLDETGKETIAFVDALSEVVGTPEGVSPPGSNVYGDILARQTELVMFGRATPEQAAENFIRELKDALANAT